jgi:hypothetical protein
MTKRRVTGRPVGNRLRFCTLFLAGASALTLGCEIVKEASWNLEATAEASAQTPARPPPISSARLLAEPKSLKQVSVPFEAARTEPRLSEGN